jgi:thiosulfate/3-mercaptopyruvate sulfurtransferase
MKPLVLAVGIVVLTACADGPTPLAPDSPQIALAGRPAVPPPQAVRTDLLVHADWLAKHLSRPNLVILHFGTRASYDAAHLPGARFVNLAALQPARNGVAMVLREPDDLRDALEEAGVSTSSHVIVYGDGIVQAARGFFILEYVGHPRVSLLDGGIAAWRAAGYPVTTEPVTPSRGSMATPTRADRLATASWLLERLGDARLFLVDARPFAEYAALVAPTVALPRLGHIPGAHSLPWQQLVVSASDPRLRDPETLRALYAATGARMQSTVVAYCFSGMLSSVAYFVARYLGYDALLYDGSMFEWSPDPSLPIAACSTPLC